MTAADPQPALESGGWRLLAASQRGRAHVSRNQPNQDAWLAASRLDGGLVLAAADGAGSARHSQIGSRIAVATVVNTLTGSQVPTDADGARSLVIHALKTARRVLGAEARRRGHSVRDYASTLLMCLVTEKAVTALQLGDGALVVHDGTALTRLARPPTARFAGETVFLTSPEALDAVRIDCIPADGVTGIALLTDGLEPVATSLGNGDPFEPFFAPLFAFAEGAADDALQASRSASLQGLLASDRVTSRTHDDTTLLLAARSLPG